MMRRLGFVAGMTGWHAVRHLHGSRHLRLRRITSAERLLGRKEQGEACQEEGSQKHHVFRLHGGPPIRATASGEISMIGEGVKITLLRNVIPAGGTS